MASTGTRRPRKAKKAVLVVDAIAQQVEPVQEPSVAQPEAQEPIQAEPEQPPARPKRAHRAAKKLLTEPTPQPISAAHQALLAAIEASADGGVVYERAETPAPAEPAALADEPETPAAPPGRFHLALKAIDGLPPIRLPIGPAIPWRLGVPGLVALVLVMFLVGRPTAHADTSFKLPAESETYAVTQDSPLFTNSQQQPQPIGVAEPTGLNVDVLDLSLKLVAVLALAYGSLVLLKRLGIGGAGSASVTSGGTTTEGLRVLSTLALAPNRSIHVVRAPDGKTLLLGATPGQVNLIAELGEVPEVTGGGSGSFLDILTSKLQH